MYYIDTQRTITRRESSLIGHRYRTDYSGSLAPVKPPSSVGITTESNASSFMMRPKGAIQKELVTSLYETMLDCIVDTWQVINLKKPGDSFSEDSERAELFKESKLKRKSILSKTYNKARRSRSRLEMTSDIQPEPNLRVWWTGADERAVIRFKNGNVYEGGISMKCMNGEGRYQWRDGTVYIGHFKDNEIVGQGAMYWKDDSWYQGEFASNLRHGHGLYIDSRHQRSYTGGWHCGTKHGNGKMYYSKDIYDSYDGEWVKNVRHGFGAREYCLMSGYKGDWDNYIRDGKGLMIWPNHDFYRGDWRNGVMSEQGIYIWDAKLNLSLSSPSLTSYRGDWHRGQRHGYGLLNFGTGWGSFYKGEFKNNKKHGAGTLVTDNGLILRDKKMFNEDNIGSLTDSNESALEEWKRFKKDPFYFKMYDDTTGFLYHVQQAYLNLDRQEELRSIMVNDYLDNNEMSLNFIYSNAVSAKDGESQTTMEDFICFEENALHKVVTRFKTVLTEIYFRYAKICNEEEIKFTPVMIRLYLWQLYFDCYIHKKGLTLVEIDNLLYENEDWLISSPHNPFERIYFWQFLHSLISVARKLYAVRSLPETRPDTIVASAFCKFMEHDVLPNINEHKGHLVRGHAQFVPLQALYKLYQSLGEPHTVRTFLCAVRRPTFCADSHHPDMKNMPFDSIENGYNAYVVGDVMAYVIDDFSLIPLEKEPPKIEPVEEIYDDLKLFNFSNLTSKYILDIFADIFPGISEGRTFVDVEIKLTFFEFFEAFMTCALRSAILQEEERNAQISGSNVVAFSSPNEGFKK